MPTDPNQLLTKLAALTPDQLKQARARISFLLGEGTTATATPSSGAVQLVYDQVRRLLSSRGHRCPPWTVAERLPVADAFETGAETLVEYVNEHLQPRGPLERLAGIRLLLMVIVRHLIRRGIPVAYRTIAVFLFRIEELVERAYPGYRASGLLPIILRRSRS